MNWEQVTWDEAEVMLSQVQDNMGQRIDGGILAPVVGLNLLGYHTTASCEGHLNWGCPYPWIEFYREVTYPDYEWATRTAFSQETEIALRDKLIAQMQMRTLLTQFTQQDFLYQALEALLADYAAMQKASNLEHESASVLLVPFAPGWYRLLAAEPDRWQRWDESERMENTTWWDETPSQEQERTLARAQAEMATFTMFLKARYESRVKRVSYLPTV